MIYGTRYKKISKDMLGKPRGFEPMGKESWWLRENVQIKIRFKRNILNNGIGDE